MSGAEVQRLLRVLASLDAHLDDQVDGLSADPVIAEARAALARLAQAAQPGHLTSLAEELEPTEATWLTEELLRRWRLLAEPVLDPQLSLVAIEEAGQVRLAVEVLGLEAGWTVAWTGAVPEDEDARTAVWTGGGAVTARVMGRGPGGRVVLVAAWPAPLPGGDGPRDEG